MSMSCTFRNDRERKPYNIDSFVKHFISEFCCQSCITEHYWDYGMFVSLDIDGNGWKVSVCVCVAMCQEE